MHFCVFFKFYLEHLEHLCIEHRDVNRRESELESAQGWIAQPAATGGGRKAKSPGQTPGRTCGWTDGHA